MSRWSYTTNLSLLSPNPTAPFVDLPFLSGIHPMYMVASWTKQYISKYIKIGRIGSMLRLFLFLAVQLMCFQKESCSLIRLSSTTTLSTFSPNPTTPFVDLPFLSGIHPMYKVDLSTKQYISNHLKNSKIGFMFRSFY